MSKVYAKDGFILNSSTKKVRQEKLGNVNLKKNNSSKQRASCFCFDLFHVSEMLLL